jgi:predicted nucleic acid-binding protein
MINVVVVDASIAIKWVLEEPDSDRADALLAEWINKGKLILAPDLLAYEITNVLYQKVGKGEITLDRAKEALAEISLTEIEFDFSSDFAVSTRAIELANHFSLPATYDSHYLALAERKDCELWTADLRMWNSVKGKLDWVRWMGDYSTPSS